MSALRSPAGEKLTIPGFLTFERAHRNARTGRNPQTGAPVDIPATHVAKVTGTILDSTCNADSAVATPQLGFDDGDTLEYAVGLLSPKAIERLLREAVRRRAAGRELLSVADRVAAAGIPQMSAEEIQAEVQAFQQEIERGCRSMNIDHVRLTTDTSLGVVLSSYLAHRLARSPH